MSSTFIGRGTTPGISFTFPFSAEEVERLFITFHGAKSGVIVEKTLGDIMFGKIIFSNCNKRDAIAVSLTQRETLSFIADETIEMQIKVKLINGVVPYSPIMKTTIGRVLKGEVI